MHRLTALVTLLTIGMLAAIVTGPVATVETIGLSALFTVAVGVLVQAACSQLPHPQPARVTANECHRFDLHSDVLADLYKIIVWDWQPQPVLVAIVANERGLQHCVII